MRYLKNRKLSYSFKLQAIALGGSSGKSVLLSNKISIEVCDPLAMTKVDKGEISKIYALNSQSGIEKDI